MGPYRKPSLSYHGQDGGAAPHARDELVRAKAGLLVVHAELEAEDTIGTSPAGAHMI